jgi:lipoyl synthase
MNGLKFPPWLRQKLPSSPKFFFETKKLLKKSLLPTVCEEAKCPNRFHCFEKKCATFLALGKKCTRKCLFCDIDFSKKPLPPDPLEPKKIALLAKKMNLEHIVITMVSRDDLEDGGANHMARIIEECRKKNPKTIIEVLTSDFQGKSSLLDIIIKVKPNIFNHNIETTASLSPNVRNKASYQKSLKLLKYVKEKEPTIFTKSGFMVGLGETEEEVKKTICDLKAHLVDIITIGQYLQPSEKCLKVKEFITPETFKAYENFGLSIGVSQMVCGPLVRSSFNTKKIL